MLKTLKELYKFDRYLLGAGYDNALKYIDHLIGLDIIKWSSGTKVGTWTVPDEWIVKDAWVKFKGKKIVDFKKEPMSLMNYSTPFKGKLSLEEFKKHLYVSDERPKAIPYEYSFYKKDWGICMRRDNIMTEVDKGCPECDMALKVKIKVDKGDKKIVVKDKLKKGTYEVNIDTEFKKGEMKIGVHTIKGKSDREILLFAHLDHPYQANDNLSGVVCLIDLAKKLKCEHTVKIIFCPETIGSIAYALTQDISKVDFMMALDIVGNDNSLLIQKSFDEGDELNSAAHLAVSGLGQDYRKGGFRFLIGSDEYVFNDPLIGIPGIMISRFPYDEYHTSDDTPKIIKKEKLEETQEFIQETIKIMENNYIPTRKFKAPLFKKKYGIHTNNKAFNRQGDYLIYLIDGKRSVIELAFMSGLGYEFCDNLLKKMENDNIIDIS